MDGAGHGTVRAAAAGATLIAALKPVVAGLLWAVLPGAAMAAATLPQDSGDKSLGMGSCASSLCHGAIETWKQSSVLQNEYVVWSRRDKHARAYTVLLGDRSKEIARKLALPEPADRSAICLDCHAHNVPAARRGDQFVLSDGVMCESCHGPAGRWIESHVARNNKHSDNIARGMYPITDNLERARLCLSCHFGNDQKFVTHKMMAAGHPRMSFELDTFTQIQPPHFRADAEGVWDGVRIWAIGQALAAEQLLGMLSDGKRGRDGLFPELVLFDCHSCHHRMKENRNAGARLGLGPGFVRLNDASLLMVRQIARRVGAGGDREFAQQVQRLHRAVASGSDALDQARTVRRTISGLVPRIASHRFAADDLHAILAGLIDDGLAGDYSDYQGAEQAVMAIQSIADFLHKRDLLRTRPIAQPMKRLLAVVAHDEDYSAAAFQQALRDLKSGLAAS